MTSKEFKKFRKKLEKTQRQTAQLLGVSIKAVHSYEQGWRIVPAHVERQIFFLVSRLKRNIHDKMPCWDRKACPIEKKNCVRPGSLRPVIFAGLSVVQFATAMFILTGKKK